MKAVVGRLLEAALPQSFCVWCISHALGTALVGLILWSSPQFVWVVSQGVKEVASCKIDLWSVG